MLYWYGLVPVAGAFWIRHKWRVFRRHFSELRLRPFLNYRTYRQSRGGIYRFIGGFESVTDGHTLWIRNEDLTVPVTLAKAQTYVLPMPEDTEGPESFAPGEEAPEWIRWEQVSALTEGAKVFVGGLLASRKDQLTFVSTREHPLMVIFYDGPDNSLAARIIRAGRHKNEYWNAVTPYAFALGALSQLVMAVNYLSRPAFRLTVITAFTAIFTPFFTLIPPGLLFTNLYRRLWAAARRFRAYRDLVRFPLRYMTGDTMEGRLPDGERYGARYFETLSPELRAAFPQLIPETAAGRHRGWCIIGALPPGPGPAAPPPGNGETAGAGEGPEAEKAAELPREPGDPFAAYGIIPGIPEILGRNFTIRAYGLDICAWVALLIGMGLNIFFIGMIISLFFFDIIPFDIIPFDIIPFR